MILLIIIEEIV